jgi:hypothetical protein
MVRFSPQSTHAISAVFGFGSFGAFATFGSIAIGSAILVACSIVFLLEDWHLALTYPISADPIGCVPVPLFCVFVKDRIVLLGILCAFVCDTFCIALLPILHYTTRWAVCQDTSGCATQIPPIQRVVVWGMGYLVQRYIGDPHEAYWYIATNKNYFPRYNIYSTITCIRII